MTQSKRQQGLTLIEVLIALAIIGVALTAVIKATSQNIRATTYLQNKMKAVWVGQTVMNELTTGARKITGDELTGTSQVLQKNFYWQAIFESTPNKRINKINVNVFESASDKEKEKTPLIQLESYVYHVKP